MNNVVDGHHFLLGQPARRQGDQQVDQNHTELLAAVDFQQVRYRGRQVFKASTLDQQSTVGLVFHELDDGSEKIREGLGEFFLVSVQPAQCKSNVISLLRV